MNKKDGMILAAILLWLFWFRPEPETDVVLTPTEPDFEGTTIEDESGGAPEVTGDPAEVFVPISSPVIP